MRQLLVTAGVMLDQGKVLLAQRRLQDAEGGKWEFPGGKVEPGEDPRLGLKRELAEELGVTVRVGQIWEVVSKFKGDDLQLVLLYFQCELVHGTPLAIECEQVGWFEPQAVDALEKPAADHTFWQQHRTTILTTSNDTSC